MSRTSKKITFSNGRGDELAAILDLPKGAVLFSGIFSPCFTCIKESHAAAKTCRALAERGIAMLRFDTTGVGSSEGDSVLQTFSNRIEDIVAAAKAMESEVGAPKLIIGHSISGTAAISAVRQIPDVRAIATIGSPADTKIVIEKFRSQGLMTEKDGMVQISVLGRLTPFHPSFVDDMLSQNTEEDTADLPCKLFIFHAPHDNIVAYRNTEIILERAQRNKHDYDPEIVRLGDAATHLFENRDEDAVFVADVITDWFRTHLY